jgi:hypothetical protein
LCRDPKANNDETYLRILNVSFPLRIDQLHSIHSLQAYEKLQTIQPAYAALLYIVEVQQCEGYGEEAFLCKASPPLNATPSPPASGRHFLGGSLPGLFPRLDFRPPSKWNQPKVQVR